MFGKLKKQMELLTSIQEQLQQMRKTITEVVQPKLSAMEQVIEAGHTEENEHLQKLGKDITRTGMAIENLTDEWDDFKEDANNRETQRIEEDSEKSELILLADQYISAFFTLRHYAAGQNQELLEQLTLIEQKLNIQLRKCGIMIIDSEQVPVDFNVHEVIEVQNAPEPELSHKVAGILTPGVVYCGKIIRKARISAWR